MADKRGGLRNCKWIKTCMTQKLVAVAFFTAVVYMLSAWLCVFGVSNAPCKAMEEDCFSFTFPFRKPKSIAALLSWRPAISSELSWLREKPYWFFFLSTFSEGCQSPDEQSGEKNGRKFRRLYIKDTSEYPAVLAVLIYCKMWFVFHLIWHK